MNKNILKNIISVLTVSIIGVSCVGCEKTSNIEYSTMGTAKIVNSYYTDEVYSYTNQGEKEQKLTTFKSDNSLCVIDVYPSYFDVTLDYENGTPEEIGRAYAETILNNVDWYEETIEPYIYENINMAFGGKGIDYNSLGNRMNILVSSLPNEYKEELIAFATAISNGDKGFKENGKISYEEALILQIVPEALRGTACSSLSLWGTKTESGEGITLRSLEWSLGSENQLLTAHAVVHMKKGDSTITSISMLGLYSTISAINDDGVFVAIHDVGANEYPFVYDGKMCYTYDIRYALEKFDNAIDVGNYMVKNSENYTYCHNLIITDKENSYCAENCVKEVSDAGDGFSVLRDENTPLIESLDWKNRDSLFVLNSFATKGNSDAYTNSGANIVRFEKYNKWVFEKEKFSVADVKSMITQEKVNQSDVENVHRSNSVHIALIDYENNDIQVAFSGKDGAVDKSVFLDVGDF